MHTQKTIPAGAGEKMQYAVHTTNDNTIRFVLRYPGQVDAGILCAAAHALAMSTDILHASFSAHSRKACWQVQEASPEDCFTLIDAQGDPMEAATQAALHPIHPEGRAQLHVTLARGESACAVAFTVSHLIADGSDALYLLLRLTEAYRLILQTGSADGLPIRSGSRDPRQAYQHLPLPQKLSLCRNPISPIRSRFPYPDEAPGEPRMTSRILPAHLLDRARLRAKACGATANDLLLAAFYRAFAAQTGHPDEGMSIMSMMDLRAHLRGTQDKMGLCNLSGALPTTLANGVSGSFADTLSEVAAQTLAAKRDPLAGLFGLPLLHAFSSALPVALLEKGGTRAAGGMALGLTNMGSIPAAELALGGAAPDAMRFAGPLKKKPALQISAASLDGACALSVAGQYTQRDAQAVCALLTRMEEEIAAYANA